MPNQVDKLLIRGERYTKEHTIPMAQRTKQLKLTGTGGWGGKRKGAGRKNLSSTVNHMARPEVSSKYPLNITLRLKNRLPSLRNKKLLKEFKRAIKQAKS